MKTYTVTFARTYEISEAEVKERITEFCNVGESAEDHDQTTEEYAELAEECAEMIAREDYFEDEFEFLDGSRHNFSAHVETNSLADNEFSTPAQ